MVSKHSDLIKTNSKISLQNVDNRSFENEQKNQHHYWLTNNCSEEI